RTRSTPWHNRSSPHWPPAPGAPRARDQGQTEPASNTSTSPWPHLARAATLDAALIARILHKFQPSTLEPRGRVRIAVTSGARVGLSIGGQYNMNTTAAIIISLAVAFAGNVGLSA